MVCGQGTLRKGEQISTCSGYVGTSTIVLGRPHYSSFTSYTPPPCNHPRHHGISPSLRHLYPQHSLPLPRCCPYGHGLLLSRRGFIAITSSTLFPSHPLPICSPLSFVFCCVNWWMQSFFELPFTATLFLLPLPCIV
jgi:hypothetical protein